MTQRERRRTVGQLLLAGFHGHTIPVELRSLAREFDLGGLIFHARNVAEPAQVADLARQAQELSKTAPVWVALGEAGGGVQPALTAWPVPATLGRADDLALTRRFARALARELRAMGVTFALGPRLDLLPRSADARIGERALSDDPATVARHAVAVIETLREQGRPACAGQFPGSGEATTHSKDELAIVDLPPDRLERVEWVPFMAAIEAGVDAVTIGHLLVPSLDERDPATLSRAIVTGRLREQLGFAGVVITDDMDHAAIAARLEPGEAAVRALAAGCDGIVQCGGDVDRLCAAIEGIVRALEEESLRAARVDDALKRQYALKTRYLSADARRLAPKVPALREVIGSAEHAAIAERMRQFA